MHRNYAGRNWGILRTEILKSRFTILYISSAEGEPVNKKIYTNEVLAVDLVVVAFVVPGFVAAVIIVDFVIVRLVVVPESWCCNC